MSALMIVMLVPSGRYLGLISYLLDLTSSQAVVMGWAPLVSASFLFIWACNWVGAIIPWSFIEIPSGELAAPTNDINVTTFAGFVEYKGRYPGKYLKPVAFQHPGRVLETVVVILPTVREYTRRRTDSERLVRLSAGGRTDNSGVGVRYSCRGLPCGGARLVPLVASIAP